MCLHTLRGNAEALGVGPLYDLHLRTGLHGLFDPLSSAWPDSDMKLKVAMLKSFERRGLPVRELIGHYRETLGRDDDAIGVDALVAALRAFRQADYRPILPDDLQWKVRRWSMDVRSPE